MLPFWKTIRDRIVAAWGGRAMIRRNLSIVVADAIALTVAFQLAFPEISVEHGAMFSTVTRLLTGLGVWLASKAMLAFTGESPSAVPEVTRSGRHEA